MAKIDLRLRLLGKLLGAVSVAKQTEEQVIRQQRSMPHNPAIDLLVGGVVRGVKRRDEAFASATASVPVRAYRPGSFEGTLPLVVLFHGGGWTTGTLNTYDWLAGTLAAEVGAVVISVDYRLAPLNPWPAAVEDCYAALVGAVARAGEFGADPDRVAVVGDSAGGNLAAVVALLARDRSGPRIAFQGLVYPATDMTMASPSIEENATAPILTKADMLAFRTHYLAGQDPADPLASPLLALDHSGLPPALIQVAEHDPLRDDGLRYADALEAAGVPVRITVYHGMTHGFLAFPHISRSAPQAMGELAAALREALGAD